VTPRAGQVEKGAARGQQLKHRLGVSLLTEALVAIPSDSRPGFAEA